MTVAFQSRLRSPCLLATATCETPHPVRSAATALCDQGASACFGCDRQMRSGRVRCHVAIVTCDQAESKCLEGRPRAIKSQSSCSMATAKCAQAASVCYSWMTGTFGQATASCPTSSRVYAGCAHVTWGVPPSAIWLNACALWRWLREIWLLNQDLNASRGGVIPSEARDPSTHMGSAFEVDPPGSGALRRLVVVAGGVLRPRQPHVGRGPCCRCPHQTRAAASIVCTVRSARGVGLGIATRGAVHAGVLLVLNVSFEVIRDRFDFGRRRVRVRVLWGDRKRPCKVEDHAALVVEQHRTFADHQRRSLLTSASGLQVWLRLSTHPARAAPEYRTAIRTVQPPPSAASPSCSASATSASCSACAASCSASCGRACVSRAPRHAS